MNIALVGYGKMGKAVEEIALSRNHNIVSFTTSKNQNDLIPNIQLSDIVIEFTNPDEAPHHILTCIKHHIPIVSGSTGWASYLPQIREVNKKSSSKVVHSSNFSIGVNLLFWTARQLARKMKHLDNYRVSIEEIHHIHKKDKPSGTAISLAEEIINQMPAYNSWEVDSNSIDSSIPIFSKRESDVIGIHSLNFNSDIDLLRLYHEAKSRTGFALGAVVAAEWLLLQQPGTYTMQDVLKLNTD